LSVSGGVYQLTGPITATSGGDCITIAVPLVSLDLNGYTINGTGSGIGIHVLAKASDALIITSVFTDNPLVSGFTTGIQFDQELVTPEITRLWRHARKQLGRSRAAELKRKLEKLLARRRRRRHSTALGTTELPLFE
jgi:hypothetical protein